MQTVNGRSMGLSIKLAGMILKSLWEGGTQVTNVLSILSSREMIQCVLYKQKKCGKTHKKKCLSCAVWHRPSPCQTMLTVKWHRWSRIQCFISIPIFVLFISKVILPYNNIPYWLIPYLLPWSLRLNAAEKRKKKSWLDF